MKNIIDVIKGLSISVLIAVLILVAGIFGFSYFLDSYTKHNVEIEVPDLNGYHLSELDGFFDNKELEYVIVDSIYNPKIKKGVVVDQSPLFGDMVKPNRKVYLTVNRTVAPKVIVPAFVDATLRGIVPKLKSIGLEVDSVINKPYNCDCVIGMLHDGNEVKENDALEKGSEVQLIVGVKTNGKVPIPLLMTKSLDEVKNILLTNGLTLGTISFDANIVTKTDSVNAFVYKQAPSPKKDLLIPIGSQINLFFTIDSNKIKDFQLYGEGQFDSINLAPEIDVDAIVSTTTEN